MLEDYSRHQQGIIKRHYKNQDTLQLQKLSESVTELYLAEGKERKKQWSSIRTSLIKLGIAEKQVEHLVKSDDPALLAEIVKDLLAK